MKSLFSSPYSNIETGELDILIDWSDSKVVDLLQKFYESSSANTCLHCITDILGSLLIALNCKRAVRGKGPVDVKLLQEPVLRTALMHRVGK